ncbi:MAG TPA: hypothetical protein VM345_14465 [Acidimicrobiales bacterium]|nr:hypothetical protein [Acidimicrobiales bacterium]
MIRPRKLAATVATALLLLTGAACAGGDADGTDDGVGNTQLQDDGASTGGDAGEGGTSGDTGATDAGDGATNDGPQGPSGSGDQ